jgi:hypothetical protein
MATQSKIKITLIDAITQEVIEREMNEAELEQYNLDKVNSLAKQNEAQAEAEAKATQKAALLERLGITEAEARLLLG